MRNDQDLAGGATEAARMRRNEPASTAERAGVEEDMARRAVRRWWDPVVWLVFAALQVPAVFIVGGAVRLWEGVTVLACLAVAAWRELHRRGAARLLDANRQRWGDL